MLPLALHVASALHYMAAEGWVHLDLKPDNLVMGIPPRVIDLSLARTSERAARLSGYVGTNAYAAPEQCAPNGRRGAGRRRLGPRRHPLPRGRGPAAVPKARVDRGRRRAEERFPSSWRTFVPWPLRVPPALADAILSCLRKRPEERPSACELALALQPLVAALPSRLVLGRRGPPARELCDPGCSKGMNQHPSSMYLRLAEGEDDLLASERSLSRRLLVLLVALVLLLASLAAAAGLMGPDGAPWSLDKAAAAPGPARPATATRGQLGSRLR